MSTRGYCPHRWRTEPAHSEPARFVDPDRAGIDIDELPPPAACPFCGNDGRKQMIWMCCRADDEGRLRYDVQCVRCHCTGPGAGEFTALAAAARWNVRGREDWIEAAAEASVWPKWGSKLN